MCIRSVSRIRSLFVGGSLFTLTTCFGQVSAPVVGLLANPEGTAISPVQGVLGASSVGSPIALFGDSRSYLAPGGGWALVRQRDGTVGLLKFSSLTPVSMQNVAGALTSPNLVSFSPGGKSAALFSATAGAVQVITGLDATNPKIAYQFSTSGLLAPQSVNISDSSALALILEQDGRLDLVSSGGNMQTVVTGSPNAGIAFLPGQSAALLVDGAAGTLSLLTGLDGVPQAQQLTASLPSAAGPVLVQTSRDGRYAFVVVEPVNSAYRIDLASGQVSSLAINDAVNRLDRLGIGDNFVVSAEPGKSAWLLIGGAANLETVFAPVPTIPQACGRIAGLGACR